MNAEAKNYARPIHTRASGLQRTRAMAKVAVRIMFHGRLKMIGTLVGVVFAVLLSNQQAGIFMGLLYKNVMYVENSGADLFVVPASTETFQPGKPMSDAVLMQSRVTQGVGYAEPVLLGNGVLTMSDGGSEPVQIVGARAPFFRGGPWNMVAGTSDVLNLPDAITFEDSERERLGGINVGSVREINGKLVRVAGLTWGLLPFGPPFLFAEYELARRMLGAEDNKVNFVLVGLRAGADLEAVRADLQGRVPEAKVMTKAEFKSGIVRYILTRTAIGQTFGTSAVFGLIVGFVIVSLSMFSAVVDNVREYGTLKALGATNMDLVRLLMVQSVLYALMGSLVGLALVSGVAELIRSPKLAMILPWQLYLGTTAGMIFMCMAAASLALLRLRKVEPGMVFR